MKAAIIGCGRMAGTIDDEVRDHPGMLFPYGHAGAYLLAPDVELVAAADPDTARREAFCDRFGIRARFDGYREMLEAIRPDIVSITTPAAGRAEIIVEAARRGVRGIYAEKALACSLAETLAIAEACTRAGTALNIGTSRRYHPAYRAARQLVDSGALGRRKVAVGYAGGALMHTHSHTVDTLLFLLGDPEVLEVAARLSLPAGATGGRRLSEDPGVEWALLTCSGGTRAALFSVPGRYEFEVVCAGGAVQAYNNGYAETWGIRRPGPAQQGGMAVWESAPLPPYDARVSPTLRAVLELVAAVRDGSPTSGGIAVARRQMEVAVACVESHVRGGAPVTLPLGGSDWYIPSH